MVIAESVCGRNCLSNMSAPSRSETTGPGSKDLSVSTNQSCPTNQTSFIRLDDLIALRSDKEIAWLDILIRQFIQWLLWFNRSTGIVEARPNINAHSPRALNKS